MKKFLIFLVAVIAIGCAIPSVAATKKKSTKTSQSSSKPYKGSFTGVNGNTTMTLDLNIYKATYPGNPAIISDPNRPGYTIDNPYGTINTFGVLRIHNDKYQGRPYYVYSVRRNNNGAYILNCEASSRDVKPANIELVVSQRGNGLYVIAQSSYYSSEPYYGVTFTRVN